MSSIMSMSSMVSSSLLINVELLEPVSMALSSDVWELEETNISELEYMADVAGQVLWSLAELNTISPHAF